VTEVPEIDDSGSSGSQTSSAGEVLPPETENPFEKQPIQEAARGLAASNPRSLGGEVGARFVAASVSHLSNDLQETKRELSDVRAQLETAKSNLSDEKRTSAVLSERLSSIRGVRHLKNVSIAAGTILIGIAIDFSRNEFDSMSVVIAGIGLLMIAMGWISPKGGGK
jgi:hypothetical protein